MFIKETELGFEINSPHYFFFFGKRTAQEEALRSYFTQYQFPRLKQVHGDLIVDRADFQEGDKPEADGQLTHEKFNAMLVSTADCIPVLIVHPPSKMVMALHAGWRGVAKRIIPKGLDILARQGFPSSEMFVVLGPHIQYRSFEVGDDIKKTILDSVNPREGLASLVSRPAAEPGKSYVDLHAIAKIQIAEFSIPSDQIFALHLDTYSDERLHSFRRDKDKAGRQLSFVVRK